MLLCFLTALPLLSTLFSLSNHYLELSTLCRPFLPPIWLLFFFPLIPILLSPHPPFAFLLVSSLPSFCVISAPPSHSWRWSILCDCRETKCPNQTPVTAISSQPSGTEQSGRGRSGRTRWALASSCEGLLEDLTRVCRQSLWRCDVFCNTCSVLIGLLVYGGPLPIPTVGNVSYCKLFASHG